MNQSLKRHRRFRTLHPAFLMALLSVSSASHAVQPTEPASQHGKDLQAQKECATALKRKNPSTISLLPTITSFLSGSSITHARLDVSDIVPWDVIQKFRSKSVWDDLKKKHELAIKIYQKGIAQRPSQLSDSEAGQLVDYLNQIAQLINDARLPAQKKVEIFSATFWYFDEDARFTGPGGDDHKDRDYLAFTQTLKAKRLDTLIQMANGKRQDSTNFSYSAEEEWKILSRGQKLSSMAALWKRAIELLWSFFCVRKAGAKGRSDSKILSGIQLLNRHEFNWFFHSR